MAVSEFVQWSTGLLRKECTACKTGTSFLVTLQYFLELISPISKSKLNKFYLDVILG